MPKLKTRKAAAKRFKITAGGAVKKHQANKAHLLTSKSSSRKRRLRRPDIVRGADARRIRKMLPYA
jgi:large subunit ribosomal protein L35